MDRLTAFFCPTEADRRRLLELEAVLRAPRLTAYGAAAVALAVLTPWIGWWMLPTIAALAGVYELAIRRRLERSAHPAVLVLAGFLLNGVVCAGAAALSGGPESPLLPWLIIPVISLAGRFNARGVWTGTAFTVIAVLSVCATDVPAFVRDPAPAIAVIPLALALGAFSAALMHAERRQRTASALDPLTGLLNRQSLAGRFEELAAQARLSGDAVALVALDIDHFKVINDTYGHARGDAVLREVAAAIRGELRAFELAYRLGGEEFLIVLPGVDLPRGAYVAERLRVRLAALAPTGVPLSASLGVSAAHGGDVDFDVLFDKADRALYAAKRAGRNRVRLAGWAPAAATTAVAA